MLVIAASWSAYRNQLGDTQNIIVECPQIVGANAINNLLASAWWSGCWRIGTGQNEQVRTRML